MQGAAARVAARPGEGMIAHLAPALALSTITVLAGTLRLYSLAHVPPNPFRKPAAGHVRFGSLADICSAAVDVRLGPKADIGLF